MPGSLVPRALFAERRFGIADGVLFAMVIAGMSFQFLIPLYVQDTLGNRRSADAVAPPLDGLPR